MEFPFSEQEWKKILTHLYKRAAQDHQFHVLCLRDPHAAIKLVSGKEIPKHFKVYIYEQPTDGMVLILPKENKLLLQMHSDKELEEMAARMAAVSTPFAMKELTKQMAK